MISHRYFDDDEEEVIPDLAYIPAPDSPTRIEMDRKKQQDEEEDDPLDAYMAGIEKQVCSKFLMLVLSCYNEV